MLHVDDEQRMDSLVTLLRLQPAGSGTIVFTRTKHGAKKLARKLETLHLRVAELQGNLSQNARERSIGSFRDGDVDVLVATNVAARGLDVPHVGLVVNYELRLLDGTLLESSIKKGQPIIFHVGMGQVIKAWDEAILDMKKGERRTLIVPHWIGYGVVGNPPKIPPYATLVFDVELLDIR